MADSYQPNSPESSLIYVVDDDPSIARLVSVNLEMHGYHAKQFDSAERVLAELSHDDPQLVIVDILMPGQDGLSLMREIRQVSGVPLMALSVLNDSSTKLTALNIGADDYVTKPFDLPELLARVRAVLRRAAPAREVSSTSVWRSGELVIDVDELRVTLCGQPVNLTPHEWAVLRELRRHAGRVVSASQLLRAVWGPDYSSERDYVRAYITRLRHKLEQDPRNPRHILLERGIGYRLAESD